MASTAPAPSSGGARDLVRVARRAVAQQLGVDARAPPPRVLQLLEHEHRGALTDDAAVAAEIERPRGARPLLVVGAHGVERAERGQLGGVEHRVGAAGEHHVGVVARDDPRGLADRLRAGGAEVHVREHRPARW